MSDTPPDLTRPGFSRRGFLQGSSVAVSSLGVMVGAARAQAEDAEPSAEAHIIILTVNGKDRQVSVEPRTTLVEALRDGLGLTGTKIGCNQGQCGACTVLLNGARVNSCLTLAVMAEGAEVVTVEGLSDPTGDLHPMQTAFAEKDAFQCGYCTPGQILSAIACIEEGHAKDAAEIREYMSGNLCRCGAYPNIVAAIEQVRDGQEG
ncbi:2Fe-2S iron-sulfur cluster-binding protein [Sulfitobacter sp.]|jgi:xanthine dehydrogenase YagT iron-sulfur-binding subunit|uniref:(2Fe-2S)-binding protein n=1 Tax=Sulfitobacter sp. TaxID=1903071 RepID=UPI0039E70A72